MSTVDLRVTFDRDGFVPLAEAFSAEVAAAMADAVWDELARKHGIDRDDRSTWIVAEPHGLGSLRKRGVFDSIATPACRSAMSELLGTEDWPAPTDWGAPLVTFPTEEPWTVPTTRWHVDAPARGAEGWKLHLKWLGYLDAVPVGGGGTLVIAGSHRLVERYLHGAPADERGHSTDLRRAVFATDPWFELLGSDTDPGRMERLMDEGATIGGVDVRVVELTGDPGDLVFLHPHLFHAGAPNASPAPRLMITGGLMEIGG